MGQSLRPSKNFALDRAGKVATKRPMTFDAFRTIDTWVFDLDHTLYPASNDLFSQIEIRMRDFVANFLGVSLTKADELRAQYWASHGTTLAGMMDIHAMPPEEFLIDVHDIDFSVLTRSNNLANLINQLPGRKIIYTNGTAPYAEQVVAARGLSGCFEAIYGVEHANYHPKPQAQAFHTVFDLANVTPKTAAMFEDDPRNLKVPKQLGMQTVLIGPNKLSQDHITFQSPDLEEFLQHLVAACFAKP